MNFNSVWYTSFNLAIVYYVYVYFSVSNEILIFLLITLNYITASVKSYLNAMTNIAAIRI